MQLLDELGKELEDMRKYRTEMELGSNASSGSKAESPGHYRELQQEIYKLKKVHLMSLCISAESPKLSLFIRNGS